MVLSSKFSCFFLLFSLFNPQLKDLFILMLITITRFWSFFILQCNVFWFDSYLLICFGYFLEFVTSAKFFFFTTLIIVLHKYGCLLGVWKCNINPYGGLVHIKVWKQSCYCCCSCFFVQTFCLVHPAIVMFYTWSTWY